MTVKRKTYRAVDRAMAGLPQAMRQRLLERLGDLPFERRRPRFLAIEPTNACNLSCPLCPVGAETMDRRRGFMDVDRFRVLMAELSGHATGLLMNFAGEPLLHPRIGEMVSCVADHGLHLILGTHGNIDKMEELVAARLPQILFAIDGVTEGSYQRYRVGGRLQTALDNLDKLVVAREKARSAVPRITLQFVVMQHNQHEIRELVALGRRMRVDEISLQPICVNDFFTEEQADLRGQWCPQPRAVAGAPHFLRSRTPRRPSLCVWALQSVVLFNGDVTACCFDTSGKHVVGNAFTPGGFRAVWESRPYRELRRRILTQELDICRTCDISMERPVRFHPDNAPAWVNRI